MSLTPEQSHFLQNLRLHLIDLSRRLEQDVNEDGFFFFFFFMCPQLVAKTKYIDTLITLLLTYLLTSVATSFESFIKAGSQCGFRCIQRNSIFVRTESDLCSREVKAILDFPQQMGGSEVEAKEMLLLLH